MSTLHYCDKDEFNLFVNMHLLNHLETQDGSTQDKVTFQSKECVEFFITVIKVHLCVLKTALCVVTNCDSPLETSCEN